MEAQLHRTQGRDNDDPLHSTDLHGGETRSVMKKVKEKVDKLKATIKHGNHGGDHRDEAATMNDSPAVRSGLAQPTVMGTPVLAEDLYATHSDIVDAPVRSFEQWEEEERRGSPPPLSTGYETHHTNGQDASNDPFKGSIGEHTDVDRQPPQDTGTHLPPVGHHAAYKNQDASTEQPMGIEKSTAMEKASRPATTVSPANRRSDPTNTGGKDVGITEVLHSFDKMKVFDEHGTKSLEESNENEPKVYTGSHDQFAPEAVENPPLDRTINITENPSNRSSNYTQRISSAVAGKAAAVKDSIVSKLSGNKRSSFPTELSHKVADTLSGTLGPVYDKMAGAGSWVMSGMQGRGNGDTLPKGTVKEYLVDTFKPGDDDKVMSEVITRALHLRKPTQETSTTTYVVRDEGERRLQDSSN